MKNSDEVLLDESDGGLMTKLKIYNPAKELGERYTIHYPVKTGGNGPSKRGLIDFTGYKIDSADFYDMNTYPRGRLLIFNIKNFLPKTDLDGYPREGTDKDAEELTKLFLDLGFIVERFDDVNKRQLEKAMRNASCEDYSDLSSLFCAFLTHGQEKVIYATDASIEIRKLTRLFHKSNLVGKPKVFIFQACQGSDYMIGLDEADGDGRLKFSLPIEADFLFAYSTARGFYSWRNAKTGSWFIQTLCVVLREHACNTDLVRMLTKVNKIIAERKSQTKVLETHNRRQIGSAVSQLRKEFYFFPPLDL